MHPGGDAWVNSLAGRRSALPTPTSPNLERQICAELNPSRTHVVVLQRANHSEAVISDISLQVRSVPKYRMVKNIQELRLKVEFDPLCNVEILRDRHIIEEPARTIKEWSCRDHTWCRVRNDELC